MQALAESSEQKQARLAEMLNALSDSLEDRVGGLEVRFEAPLKILQREMEVQRGDLHQLRGEHAARLGESRELRQLQADLAASGGAAGGEARRRMEALEAFSHEVQAELEDLRQRCSQTSVDEALQQHVEVLSQRMEALESFAGAAEDELVRLRDQQGQQAYQVEQVQELQQLHEGQQAQQAYLEPPAHHVPAHGAPAGPDDDHLKRIEALETSVLETRAALDGLAGAEGIEGLLELHRSTHAAQSAHGEHAGELDARLQSVEEAYAQRLQVVEEVLADLTALPSLQTPKEEPEGSQQPRSLDAEYLQPVEDLRTELRELTWQQQALQNTVRGLEVLVLPRVEAELAEIRKAGLDLPEEVARQREEAGRLQEQVAHHAVALARLEALEKAPSQIAELRGDVAALTGQQLLHTESLHQLQGLDVTGPEVSESVRQTLEDASDDTRRLRDLLAEHAATLELLDGRASSLHRRLEVLENGAKGDEGQRAGHVLAVFQADAHHSGGLIGYSQEVLDVLPATVQKLEEALEAEAQRRCVLIAELHARIAREVAEVSRRVELHREQLAGQLSAGLKRLQAEAVVRAGEDGSLPGGVSADKYVQLFELIERERSERVFDTTSARAEALRAVQQERDARSLGCYELRASLAKEVQLEREGRRNQVKELVAALEPKSWQPGDEAKEGSPASPGGGRFSLARLLGRGSAP